MGLCFQVDQEFGCRGEVTRERVPAGSEFRTNIQQRFEHEQSQLPTGERRPEPSLSTICQVPRPSMYYEPPEGTRAGPTHPREGDRPEHLGTKTTCQGARDNGLCHDLGSVTDACGVPTCSLCSPCNGLVVDNLRGSSGAASRSLLCSSCSHLSHYGTSPGPCIG